MSSPGVVTFDYATWAGQYPALAALYAAPQAQGFFNQACLYLDNTGASAIADAAVGGTRETILYMLTSHVAGLDVRATQSADVAGAIVGRMNAASEGSASAGFENLVPGSAAWFAQTRFGFAAWQAMLPWRTAFYRAAPQIGRSNQSFPMAIGRWPT
jgi:hypothetical protein